MFNQKEYDRTEYFKEYRQKNKEKRKIQFFKWSQKNKEHLKKRHRLYKIKNRVIIYKKRLEWDKNNPDKVRQYHQNYALKHPEKILEFRIRSLEKYAIPLKLTFKEYKSALISWAKTIKKRSNYLCFCGNKAVNTHHIFHKAKYPKLSLNLNNGIALCLQHHNEAHGKNF